MTLMSMIDYGLIVIFFIGVASLTLVIARSRDHKAAPQVAPPPQKAKGAYALLALLVALLIALAFVAQRGQSHAS